MRGPQKLTTQRQKLFESHLSSTLMQAKLVYFSVSKMSGSQGQLEQLSLLALASQGWEQEHDSRMKPNGCPQRLTPRKELCHHASRFSHRLLLVRR